VIDITHLFEPDARRPTQPNIVRLLRTVVYGGMEGSMKVGLLLQGVGMGIIMLGGFSTSWFGKLDWAIVPFRFRWAVGASQFFFLLAGIVLGVAACH